MDYADLLLGIRIAADNGGTISTVTASPQMFSAKALIVSKAEILSNHLCRLGGHLAALNNQEPTKSKALEVVHILSR